MGDALVEKRRYIRHPSEVPIEVGAESDDCHEAQTLRNVSLGGICFHSAAAFDPGKTVHVKVELVRPVFEARGRVVWCRQADEGFDVGVEFVDTQDAFRARMVEQICHIEQYRNEVLRNEGRTLSPREAALEWIGKYADRF